LRYFNAMPIIVAPRLMTLTTVPTISAEYHKSRQILENTKAAVRDFSTAVRPAKAGVFSGNKPIKVEVRRLVAWIAGGRESELLKPIDKAIHGMVASHRAVTKVNAEVAPKLIAPEAEPSAVGRRQHGSPQADWRGEPLWRGGSDSTMARTR
jgi:hypothetical protein